MTAIKNLIFALITFLAFAGLAIAGPVNVDSNGLALEGNDPVAYFTMEKPVKGSAAFSATHEGATYYFASADNKAMFETNPTKYTPQYGGFCAFGMASGYQAPVETDKFTVVDGKLYLNYNGSVQSKWRKDISGYVSKANQNWTAQ